jgi:heptosyltransferase I
MKILIVKSSALGDIIHAFPVLSYLKLHYPNAQIDWVVEKPFSELLKAHPDIHQIHLIHSKQWRKTAWKKESWSEFNSFMKTLRSQTYDLVLDLQGNVKSGLVTALAKSKKKVGFGYPSVPEWPNILATHLRFNPPKGQNIREDYLFLARSAVGDSERNIENNDNMGIELRIDEAQKFIVDQILESPIFQEGKRTKKIMVCLGSQWPNKKLSLPTLTELLHLIGKELNGRFLLIWGTPDEKGEVEQLHQQFLETSLIAPKLSLPTLQRLMQSQDLIITMDSLPLHLAGTTQTPTYSIFGPSLASKYKSTGKHHHSFQGFCPYGKKFEKRCPILRSCKTGSCMKDLSGVVLFADWLAWWRQLS